MPRKRELALQDRVGARLDPESMGCSTWKPEEFIPQAAMYEKAFVAKFANKNSPEPWINVESFEWGKGPAEWSRFEQQLRIVPRKARQVITWEYGTFSGALRDSYRAALKPKACR